MPTLSVVIPTFNEETVLPLLLQAIRKQTLQPKEVIVADANSTDRTREIARTYGAFVVDGGLPGPGRNRGAEVATGAYLVFFDADAVLPDEAFLEQALAEMEARDLGVACPMITSTRGLRARFYFWLFTRATRLLVRKYPHALGTCIFVRRSVHEEMGGFDETILYAEDNDYGFRASQLMPFGYLDLTVKTPPRRFERDGYIKSALVVLLAGVHIRLFGPIRHDLFRYRFGHKPEEEK